MILKASQRGGGAQLATHLLKAENEHVEVHEIRGFVANDVRPAFKEAQAIAMGTRCKQYLFSVSLNPPADQKVDTAAFESALSRIEAATGLTGQPRVVIFHEKEGRRHAHAVWSRIDATTMKARPLSFFKTKLREVSKALYLEHGWQMPRGMVDSKERDPRNFSLAEWQQAKRIACDPAALKAVVQECWTTSDSRAAFDKALEARGLYLARGDRRAHVIVTYEGEVMAVARLIGKNTKEVTARLGEPDTARSVEATKTHIAASVAPRLDGLLREAKETRRQALAPLHAQREAMRDNHKDERQRLGERQRARRVTETKERAARLRGGVRGLWDRLTGRHSKTVKLNEAETKACGIRDRTERDDLVANQLRDRRGLQREILAVRGQHAANVLELHRDLARQGASSQPDKDTMRDRFNDAASGRAVTPAPRRIVRGRSRGRDGPELGR